MKMKFMINVEEAFAKGFYMCGEENNSEPIIIIYEVSFIL